MPDITIHLTEAELALVQSALDSFEYWEHRDSLAHDSGYVTLPEDDDTAYSPEDLADPETLTAIESVRQSRALSERLQAAERAADTFAQLDAQWRQAFDALRSAGLEADADHPIAAAYRAASDAVNHANRKREAS